MNTEQLEDIIAGIAEADNRSVARAISLLEDEDQVTAQLLDRIYPATGNAAIIGITGPPGAGKSTLIESLLSSWLAQDMKLGVIAVDPTSPYTGGAILGDRIRMYSIASDPRVFIRSMATRGNLGGLSPRIKEAIQVLDAAGMDMVVIETVGVGQSEIDIVKVADTVIMVTVPEAGDDIQVLKSGVMEIGDIFLVNKADRPGSQKMKILLEAMVEQAEELGWKPPVIMTVASKNQGIAELTEVIEMHQKFLQEKKLGREKRRYRSEEYLLQLLQERFNQEILLPLSRKPFFKEAVAKLAAREGSPYRMIAELVKHDPGLRKIFAEKGVSPDDS